MSGAALSRRGVLGAAGALVVAFGWGADAEAQEAVSDLPGSLKQQPRLDGWLRVGADGAVTVFTGKVELGQGIRTALLQVAAEELGLAPGAVTLVTGDTARTANEGFTAGSHSMKDSGTAIRHAAARARALLLAEAGRRLGLEPASLRAEAGEVRAPDGRALSFGALAAALGGSDGRVPPEVRLAEPAGYRVVGQPVPRVDIPAKVTGGAAYVQDMRPEGMLHARVVRPPGPGARLEALDDAAVRRMPGVVAVVRDGSFLAVVAEREFGAVRAMRALSAAARWRPGPALPKQEDFFSVLAALPSRNTVILDEPVVGGPPVRTLEARFSRAYQMHGSIGPSCALALFRDGGMTVWTHTQGVFPDRRAIAEMLRLPTERVRLVHVEGSGCYGHNGADDAAADAALVARAVPGRPVRLQWMMEQERAWEPYGPAMLTRVKAGLDAAGRVVGWDYAVRSNTHSTRPGPAGALLAARLLAEPFPAPAPTPIPQPEGGGDRNGIPLYRFDGARVLHEFVPEMPLRVSAMRGLGAYMNVFSIEGFVDELAAAAGADPVEFRLRHLEDPRARDVVTEAARHFGWGRPAARGRGHGFGFARYKNLAAYCAVAAEVEVRPDTGRVRLLRAVAAVDAGQVVNPDGLRNQVEGAIVQSASWTLYESVGFDESGITSVDWSTYPVMRFNAVPESVEVHVIDRPGQPFLGAGETGQGPTAAAVANAVSAALGRRMRDLPLTRERVREAVGGA